MTKECPACKRPVVEPETSGRSTAGKLVKLAGLLFVSAAVAFLSVKIERRGPELVQFSDMCGATHDQPCMRPSLKGGYPLAFLVDTPGVSVENQLFLGEDQFVPLAFVTDWAACAATLWFLYWARSRRQRVRSAASKPLPPESTG